jgi:hypothetical protein
MHDTRRERSDPRRAPSLHVRPAGSRSFASSRLLRVAFRTRLRPCAAWPGDAGLPSFVARRRSWGSIPSQVSSRLRVDARHTFDATHPRIPGLAAQDAGFHWVGISAGPGPPVVRASASAPIDFRRGDRSPVGETRSAKAVGRGFGWRRLLGFGSRLRSAPEATRRPRDAILPWALPLAGLSGTWPCNGPGSTPVPITSLRIAVHVQINLSATRDPIRSWVYGGPFRPRQLPARAARRSCRWRQRCLSLREAAFPSAC